MTTENLSINSVKDFEVINPDVFTGIKGLTLFRYSNYFWSIIYNIKTKNICCTPFLFNELDTKFNNLPESYRSMIREKFNSYKLGSQFIVVLILINDRTTYSYYDVFDY